MSIVTKAILKGYFETGDRPTQGQFIDLIDSFVTLTYSNTGDVTIVGTLTVDNINIGSHISASRIKASAGFSADTLTTSSFGYISASEDIFTKGILQATTVSASQFSNIYSITHITSSGDISASGDIYGATGSFGHISASTLQIANTAQFGESTVHIDGPLGNISASGRISASGGFETDESTSSFGHISASGNISTSANVYGSTGSFGYLEGDGSGLTNIIDESRTHGNKPSVTGSIVVPSGQNNTIVTNNTGEFTVPAGATYTVSSGSQIDLQYTPIAERLYRYNVDTGTFKAYAQANIDSETTLMKGFGAGTAGVGNDSTIRYNATVPENFVTILHTTTNVTQSEDPNNNPMTTDPHSITIQDQSTYTVKSGADVTVDGVHHGVVRKDIALFKTMGIGDTQAIGPSGSNSFNDQYNNIYPSASAHLHISASNPVVKIEAASGTGLLSIDGNISASGAITANTLLIDGATIDFTNLPTSDPSVAGRLWNDSNTVKVSAG